MIVPHIYYERKESRFLDIGDVVFLTEEAMAQTTLGSCVSVCLFSHQSRTSIVCHAQMPERKMKNATCSPNCPIECQKGQQCQQNNKYVESVIPFMISAFDRRGIPRQMVQAVVVGGASMLPALRTLNPVGILNADMACAILAKASIKIVYCDTGGVMSRRLEIQNDTGLVFVNKSLVFKMWDRQTRVAQ